MTPASSSRLACAFLLMVLTLSCQVAGAQSLPALGSKVTVRLGTGGLMNVRAGSGDYQVWADSLSGPANPTTHFYIRPGLSNGSCVSFESVAYPGRYLRHAGYVTWAHPSDGSALFLNDATFCKQVPLDNSLQISFLSINYPTYYLISDTSGRVRIGLPDGLPDFASRASMTAEFLPSQQLFYRFEDSSWTNGALIADSSGYANSGTITGAVTSASASPPICSSRYAVFTGGARIITLYKASFTTAFWARVDGGTNTYRGSITSRSVASNISGFNVYAASNNKWELWTGNGSGFESLTATPVLVGQWVHIATMFSASTGPDANGRYTGIGSVYVNGQLVATMANMGYVPNTQSPFVIGSGGNGDTGFTNYPFVGALDDVRHFDRALQQAEVQELMTGGCPGGFSGSVWWSRAGSLSDSKADGNGIDVWPNEALTDKKLVGSSTRPKFTNNNSNNINFNPVVQFTSATSTATSAQYFIAPSFLGGGTHTHTHFLIVGYPSGLRNHFTFFEGTQFQRVSSQFVWGGGEVIFDSPTPTESVGRAYVNPSVVNRPTLLSMLKNANATSQVPLSAAKGIRENGILKVSAPSSSPVTGRNSNFYFGWNPTVNGGGTFQGVLAEGIFLLDQELSASQLIQIESYLSVKYGVTLGGNGAADTSYLDSRGGNIWLLSTGYHNNIVGIGRDDSTKLNQLISRSVNSGDQITIISGATMPSNSSTITPTTGATALAIDRSYVLIGDNGLNAASTTSISAGAQAGRTRSSRIWRIQVTGTAPPS